MRGKGLCPRSRSHASGITPAYAGKSVLQLCQRHEHRDHPRLCGEKDTCDTGIQQNPGSPPPMRGKAGVPAAALKDRGITPAYAGKRLYHRGEFFIIGDHPRLCGEKFRIHLFITCQPGSPPPMRGKD